MIIRLYMENVRSANRSMDAVREGEKKPRLLYLERGGKADRSRVAAAGSLSRQLFRPSRAGSDTFLVTVGREESFLLTRVAIVVMKKII